MNKRLILFAVSCITACLHVSGETINGYVAYLRWVFDEETKVMEISLNRGDINPKGIEELSSYAKKAGKVILAEGMTSMDVIFDRYSLEFENCEEIVCPSTFKELYARDVRKFPNIKRIELPDNLEYIEEDAFKNTELSNSSNWVDGALYIGKCLIAVDENWAWRGSGKVETFRVKEGTLLIAEDAFGNNNEDIKRIILPNSITTINNNAFYGTGFYKNKANWINGMLYCGKCLIRVDADKTGVLAIKEGTTTVADRAFYDSKISSVTLPSTITHIGQAAFEHSSITKIVLPSSISHIAPYTFDACRNLTSITIPGTITHIGICAFSNCELLPSISLPSGITTIEGGTFARCRNLKTISIPNKVKIIGESAFYECESLFSVTLPEGLEIVESRAFAGAHINQINFPNSLQYVGYDAFTLCGISSGVNIPNHWRSIDGIDFRNCESLKEVRLPDSLQSLRAHAFEECSNLTSISIPENVKYIGERAFAYCENLSSLYLPDNLDSIGENAFLYCSNLTSIRIPENVKFIGDGAFRHCENLSSINIPDNLDSIGEQAFLHCDKLMTITSTPYKFAHLFPATSIQRIYISKSDELRSFNRADFPNIKEVVIKESVKHLNPGFYSLTEQNIIVPDFIQYIDDYAFKGMKNLQSITLPQNVVSIGKGAFDDCAITKINIPAKVETIGENAFASCQNLKEIIVDELNNNFCSIDGVLYNKEVSKLICFPYNKQLAEYRVPSSLKELGQNAFSPKEYPLSIVCEYGISNYFDSTKISELVFSNNEELSSFDGSKYINLSSVVLNSDITVIPANAFANCVLIKELNLPASLKTIGSKAFFGCHALKEINLPNIDSIGVAAFANCTNLQSINISAENLHYASELGVLYNKEKSLLIQFPAGKQEISFNIPVSVEALSPWAFAYNKNLESLVLPKTITIIPQSLFEGCAALKSFNFTKSVTEIGERAFADCLGLTSIEIPKSITILGNEAFDGCVNLQSVKVKGKLAKMSIGENVFPDTTKVSAK